MLLWSLEKGHLDFSHHFQLGISSKANSRVSFESVNRKYAAREGRRGHLTIFPVLLKWHQYPVRALQAEDEELMVTQGAGLVRLVQYLLYPRLVQYLLYPRPASADD